jgi:hypothetical protein
MSSLALVQQLQNLIEQLRVLIECVDHLQPSPERDAAVHDLARYRDWLNAIVERQTLTLN